MGGDAGNEDAGLDSNGEDTPGSSLLLDMPHFWRGPPVRWAVPSGVVTTWCGLEGRHDSPFDEEVRVAFYGTSSWTLGLGRPIVRPADVGTAQRQVCVPHNVFHLLIDTSHAVNVPHYRCATRYKG